MSEKVYEIKVPMPLFKQATTVMDKYFGFNAEYFQDELAVLPGFNIMASRAYARMLDSDHPITLWSSNLEEFNRCMSGLDGFMDEAKDELLTYVLLLVMIIWKDKDYDAIQNEWCQENEDHLIYDECRADLLRLYIFVNSEGYKTNKKGDYQSKKIVIKKGDHKCELDNKFNWFKDSMVKRYLKDQLGDIKSIEQAEEELARYRKTKGRRHDNIYLIIMIQGIVNMFNEELNMEVSLPKTLSLFMLEFFVMLGLMTEEEAWNPRAKKYKGPEWIGAQVSYLKDHPVKKFYPMETISDEPFTLEDLKAMKPNFL